MSKSTNPARGKVTAGLRWLAGIAVLMALAAFPVPSNAGTAAIDNSVQLDPFNPVPEIQFSRDDGYCDDGCGHRCAHDCERGWRDCERDCRYHSRRCERDCRDGWSSERRVSWRDCDRSCRYGAWYCEHDCRNNWYGTGWRECDRDCSEGAWHCRDGCALSYRALLRDYEARSDRQEDQADRYDEQADRYDRQSLWYKRHVIDKDRWYDGHTWHISPLQPLADIFSLLTPSIDVRPYDRYRAPPPGTYTNYAPPYDGPPQPSYRTPPPGQYEGPPPEDYGPPD